MSLFSAFAHKLNNKLGALHTASDQLMLEEGNLVDADDVTLAEIIRSESEYILATESYPSLARRPT